MYTKESHETNDDSGIERWEKNFQKIIRAFPEEEIPA